MKISTRFIPACALALCLPLASAADTQQAPYTQHADYPAFVERMKQHGFTREELDAIFNNVAPQPKIIELITRPAESKDWHEYEPIFMTAARIEAGVNFWNENAATIARAAREFGVDQEAIVAIIGVETFYGRITGSWRVLEALSTLGFDYPPRSRFFISELEHFLQLVQEESIDPAAVTGSYAGAMGGGQFMPSSYREYAVDFDKDGQRDLWNSWADVVGSVASYLSRHGWRHGDTIAVPAVTRETASAPLGEQGMKKFRAGELREAGMVFSDSVADDTEVRLVALQNENDMSYWIGLHNFGVINRYNRSPLYAVAVMQLGEAIRRQREAH